MTNYELEREEREMERELKALSKVEKEREQRKQFAETLQNPILNKMVLDTINDNPNLFELEGTQANFNLKYYDNCRNDNLKGGE